MQTVKRIAWKHTQATDLKKTDVERLAERRKKQQGNAKAWKAWRERHGINK